MSGQCTRPDEIRGLLARPLARARPRQGHLGLYLRRHRSWVAVVLSSTVFGVWHVLPTLNSLDTNPGASATADRVLLQAGAVAFVVLATGFVGAFFSWLRLRSGSILAPWLTHTGFNAMGYLGSRIEGLLSK